MKTLLVLRHAKASQDASFAADFARPLTSRGRSQALAVGRMMREQKLAVDAIVASPAVRVVETITGVLEGAGLRIESAYDRRIYNASPQSLLLVIREGDDKAERVMVVGHNPGLPHLLLNLAEEDQDGLRGNVAGGYPTATLAELRLSVDHWQDVAPGSGRIVSLFRPED